MKKLRFIVQAAAGLAVAAVSGRASAALFSLTSSSSYTNGTDAGGNYKIFSAADGTQVKVTAWTMTDSGAIVRSSLGIYDQGLGVTAPDTGLLNGIGDNGGSGNLHTVDNKGSTDFLVFQFSTDVTANSVKLSPFDIVQSSNWWSTTYSSDTDATVKYGDTAAAWASYINFASAGVLASAFTDTQSLYSNTGRAVTQTLTDPTPAPAACCSSRRALPTSTANMMASRSAT
jgi:hypothetical protein